MIFHENHLLADDSDEIPYFIRKLGKMSQNLSSAAVVIGVVRLSSNTECWLGSFVIYQEIRTRITKDSPSYVIS